VGVTARRNVVACVGNGTPRLIKRANALSGFAVVISRAIAGNDVTLISKVAPSGSKNKSQTISTVVVSLAACRNGNAGELARTPRESDGAYAGTGFAIVIVRALSRNVVAAVGFGAPVCSKNKSVASSASIVACAAGRNVDAGL